MGLTVTEARRRLKELVERALAGEEILIGRYGRDEVTLISSATLRALRGEIALLTGIESGGDPLAIQFILDRLAHDVGTDVWTRAVETFGDPQRAGRWLLEPNRALGGRSPSAVAAEDGPDAVMTLLGRIDHGLIS